MLDDFLISIFCLIDDFYKDFDPVWQKYQLPISEGDKSRKRRSPSITVSEIMTIAICFHASKIRTFKDYYNGYVLRELQKYFPKAPSYSRFVSLMKRVLCPLVIFLQSLLGVCSGVSFVDSTVLTVCHARRISSHKVFRRMAQRGKTSTGWFFGFKLHLIINDQGEILAFMLTAGNVDDRRPLPGMVKSLWGKCFGDKGYLSSRLFDELWEKGVQLITKLRKGMHNKLMSLWDRVMLRRRGLIESVNNKLKNSCQIEHHRHRSPWNFLVNLFSGLAAYCQDPRKPSLLKADRTLIEQLVA
jgi:hypothetical protein